MHTVQSVVQECKQSNFSTRGLLLLWLWTFVIIVLHQRFLLWCMLSNRPLIIVISDLVLSSPQNSCEKGEVLVVSCSRLSIILEPPSSFEFHLCIIFQQEFFCSWHLSWYDCGHYLCSCSHVQCTLCGLGIQTCISLPGETILYMLR